MIDSILLYAGLGVAFLGALSIVYPLRFLRIRTRGRGALLFLAGLIVFVVALALPTTEKRVIAGTTLLDEAMPVWQFDEKHSIEVDAPPDRIFEAIHNVTADDIFLFRTLIAVRRFGRKGPESILNPSEHQSILDVATRTTFVVVADAPPRELVVGTVVAAPAEARRTGRLTRDLFYRKLQPGVALATMNFLVTPLGPTRSRVSTETRVFANTPETARRFAVYWRVIHPGSDIIRRSWLRAIKRRANDRA
jgi:hypothetical protein